jgi:hypothetical protein
LVDAETARLKPYSDAYGAIRGRVMFRVTLQQSPSSIKP